MNLIGSKQIETERLFLRSSKMEEQKRLWEILMIPEVNKWYLTSGKKYAKDPSHWTWQVQKQFYQYKVDNANHNDVFAWSIFLKSNYTDSKKEEVIGQVTAQESGSEIDIRDVGWYIDPKYQGKGYAKEAAQAMIDYLFNEVDISKISSGAVKENLASCKIFERLGFTKIKECEEESPYTFYDGILTFSKYELTKEQYFKNNKINFEKYYVEGKNKKSNCVVRSLCKILKKDYDKIYSDLLTTAKELNCDAFNDIPVFEKYMENNNILKTDFNKDIKIKNLKLDNNSYIVFCYDKKEYYHMIPIINNIIYDKSIDCMDLYVISIYKKK